MRKTAKTETPEIVEKEIQPKKEVVPKMTTLQALDNLFGPPKTATTKKNLPKKPKKALAVKENTITLQEKKTNIEQKTGASIKLVKPTPSENTKNFTCNVCKKVNFTNMDALRKHLSYHPHHLCQDKVHVCYICDEKFDIKDTLFKSHLVGHLQKMKVSVDHKCLGCYKTFTGREKLLSHVLSVHERNKTFPCPLCEVAFERKKQLLFHAKSVHDFVPLD